NAISTRSMSGCSAKQPSMIDSCVAGAAASNTTVSTVLAPAAIRSSTWAATAAGSRTPSTTVPHPLATSLRLVAWAISEPPPSTSAACTAPSALRISGSHSLRGEHLSGEGQQDGQPAQKGGDDQTSSAHGDCGARYSCAVGTAGRIPWPKRLYSLLG